MASLEAWYQHCVTFYGVNPLVFMGLYLAKNVVHYYLLYRIARSIRRGHWAPVPTWITLWVGANMAPWVYVYLYGRNLPSWFHGLFLAVLAGSALLLGWQLRRRMARNAPVAGSYVVG